VIRGGDAPGCPRSSEARGDPSSPFAAVTGMARASARERTDSGRESRERVATVTAFPRADSPSALHLLSPSQR